MKGEKEISSRGNQGDTVYGTCSNAETATTVIGHVDQMRSIQPKVIVAKTENLSQKDVTHQDESVTHQIISGSLIYLTARRSDLGLTLERIEQSNT